MWSSRYLTRLDFRVIPVIFSLMLISLFVISAYTVDPSSDHTDEIFFTPIVAHKFNGLSSVRLSISFVPDLIITNYENGPGSYTPS